MFSWNGVWFLYKFKPLDVICNIDKIQWLIRRKLLICFLYLFNYLFSENLFWIYAKILSSVGIKIKEFFLSEFEVNRLFYLKVWKIFTWCPREFGITNKLFMSTFNLIRDLVCEWKKKNTGIVTWNTRLFIICTFLWMVYPTNDTYIRGEKESIFPVTYRDNNNRPI